MQYYNVHAHLFTMRNAPRNFLSLYMPKFAAHTVDVITNTDVGSWIVRKLLKVLPGNWGDRYASFLEIGKSSGQMDVFKKLISQYDDPSMKFIALTQYMEKCGVEESESGFEGQLEEILKVKQQYPDNLLIFLGVDPRWKATGKELKEAVELYFNTRLKINDQRSVNPFAGLKIYPSCGFYAFDEKLKETFEWAAKNEVPVLTHCSYLGGIFTNETAHIKANLNSLDIYTGKKYADNFPNLSPPAYQQSGGFWTKLFRQTNTESNKNTCSYFLEPASYETTIDYFSKLDKPLKICLAHYGGSEHIIAESNSKPFKETLFGMKQENWCKQIKELMLKYSNVYTDISYAVSNKDTHQPVLKDVADPVIGNRIMYGTDFFMTEREMPEKKDYEVFKSQALSFIIGNTNAWEKMASANTDAFLHSNYYPGKVV